MTTYQVTRYLLLKAYLDLVYSICLLLANTTHPPGEKSVRLGHVSILVGVYSIAYHVQISKYARNRRFG